jgi:hypothetical protein
LCGNLVASSQARRENGGLQDIDNTKPSRQDYLQPGGDHGTPIRNYVGTPDRLFQFGRSG